MGYPTIRGEAGYYFDADQDRQRTKLYTDQSILTELGVPALAQLDPSQVSRSPLYLKTETRFTPLYLKAQTRFTPLLLRMGTEEFLY